MVYLSYNYKDIAAKNGWRWTKDRSLDRIDDESRVLELKLLLLVFLTLVYVL